MPRRERPEKAERSEHWLRVAVNARTGGVAGFVTFDPAASRLHQIVVASSARGAGAAKMLLDEAKRLSPSGLSVDVDAANARAVRFFDLLYFSGAQHASRPTPFRCHLRRWLCRAPRAR